MDSAKAAERVVNFTLMTAGVRGLHQVELLGQDVAELRVDTAFEFVFMPERDEES